MQGQDIGSAEKDSEKYFNKCAESFNLKYPVGATEPINVKKEQVNDHLSKALFELEQHVNDFRKKFHKFPHKHWTKYVPEQDGLLGWTLIRTIRAIVRFAAYAKQKGHCR